MNVKFGSLYIEQRDEGEWFLLWQTEPTDDDERAILSGVRLEPIDALGLLKFLKTQEAKFKESVVQAALLREENRP